jgi:Ser-tRNA(Ala) deacylase AlaX
VPRGLQLCYSDAYARSVEARVLAVELEPAASVVLDATVFYPGGGG